MPREASIVENGCGAQMVIVLATKEMSCLQLPQSDLRPKSFSRV